jgi:hypothetical protein
MITLFGSLSSSSKIQNEFLPSTPNRSEATGDDSTREPLVNRARALFRRVPVLGALCSEGMYYQCRRRFVVTKLSLNFALRIIIVLVCQSISSLLSFLFVVCTKEAIPDDGARARHMGNVSSTWNGLVFL